MTAAEHAAFWRGFDLAKPPGSEEADALDRAEEFAPAGSGQIRVAVSKDTARSFLAEVDVAPENLAAATWLGFLRGMVARSGGALVRVHEVGRA